MSKYKIVMGLKNLKDWYTVDSLCLTQPSNRHTSLQKEESRRGREKES